MGRKAPEASGQRDDEDETGFAAVERVNRNNESWSAACLLMTPGRVGINEPNLASSGGRHLLLIPVDPVHECRLPRLAFFEFGFQGVRVCPQAVVGVIEFAEELLSAQMLHGPLDQPSHRFALGGR